ncbi:DUF983 domain-containing protein [Polaribacter undariae]|uniref:DUF983 domain-containing protein n=1 Tax=Polaribacter sejongensis TaxID=985043 RepID=A0AAJ1QV18_9FLAO|nr:DUF983 domain-containing protein [Polaribacter undariae]MDN3618455.1 DUF983 domain-containing protein [Polaribacter undariae]UWD30562.1 DUF983 domain-containing protein [Polaribacter undariae]
MANVIDMLKCKCPNCKKGKMYSELGNLLMFRSPKMYTTCSECHFKFEKEPGFFFGAMFVTYALVSAEMIAGMVLFKFILDFSYITVALLAITTIILLSTFNLRISRSIWIYMFYSN